jgi:hypothetical protein
MDTLYPYGIPQWRTIPTATYEWMLLLSTYSPDPTADRFVADIAADEATDASYSRIALTSGAQVIEQPDGRTRYTADDPVFGNLVGAEALAYAVLYRLVTTDADSILLAAYRIAKTTDGTPVTVVLDPLGLTVQQIDPWP